jgi:RNA polymerase sigma factor (TIGR02999 family)
MDDTDRIQGLLEDAREGSAEASKRLFDALYAELRDVAGRVFGRQRPGHTLSPTVLVHEAYVRLVSSRRDASPVDRAHFLNLAARAMRQVLVNHERDRRAAKRGGGRERRRVTLSDAPSPDASAEVDLLDLDDALASLERLDDRQARIAEMRLFGGLTTPEIAPLLGVSTRTVELDWRMAKAHLAARLAPPAAPASP